MNLSVRVLDSEGAVCLSAFGLRVEIDHAEGNREVVISKRDGVTSVELREAVSDAVTDDMTVSGEHGDCSKDGHTEPTDILCLLSAKNQRGQNEATGSCMHHATFGEHRLRDDEEQDRIPPIR